MNKRWYRIVQDIGGWGKYCFVSPHFVVLVLLMSFAWAAGALFDLWLSGSGSSLTISFYRLFDFGMIPKAPSIGLKIVSLFEFLFTWSIGSGILLTILVDRTLNYYRQVREGAVRYRIWVCSHAIILGWNPSALVHIKELIDHNKYCSLRKVGNAQTVKTVLILSESPVEVVRSQLKAISADRLKGIEVLVYKCIFDSKDELDYLHLDKAARLYVVGENADIDDMRDTRSLLAMDQITGAKQLDKRNTTLPCCVWISKYSLYHRLIAMASNAADKLEVRYQNYYVNWARRLWGLYPSLCSPQIQSSANLLLKEKGRTVRLVLVGFSQMGQAMTEFILRSGYVGTKIAGSKASNVIVDVFDRKADERRGDFLKLFHALNYPKLQTPNGWMLPEESVKVNFKTADIHSDEFYSHLRVVYGYHLGGAERLVVVLGFNGVDDMMATALTVQEIVGKDVPIFVRQNLSGVSCGIEERMSLFEIRGVSPFGSMSGAGYNYWRCREFREKLLEHIHERKNRGGQADAENDALSDLASNSYCEVVPSIFAAAGYLLCEMECRSDGDLESHLETMRYLENSLVIRSAIHKCKMMERLMSAAAARDAESVVSRWDLSSLSDEMKNMYEQLQQDTIMALQDIGYVLTKSQAPNVANRGCGIEAIGNDFLMRYGVSQEELSDIGKVRNPHIEQLLRHGEQIGNECVEACRKNGISVEWRIGGSLAYEAVLNDRYDVDLRLLVDGDIAKDTNVIDKVDKVKEVIADKFASRCGGQVKLLVSKGASGCERRIWQLQRIDNDVEGVDRDVIILCNVEDKGNYEGLAAIASKLPKAVIDRLIMVKAKAKKKGEEDYRDLKRHWKQFLKDLRCGGIETLQEGSKEIRSLLMKNGYPQKYPVFLRERV